jgi:hypothetical protein
MSPNAGRGGSCGVSANEYSCTQEPTNFRELTPYLIYDLLLQEREERKLYQQEASDDAVNI